MSRRRTVTPFCNTNSMLVNGNAIIASLFTKVNNEPDIQYNNKVRAVLVLTFLVVVSFPAWSFIMPEL